MIFNDYFDLEVDRINAPQRPLPAGLLSQNEAIAFGLITRSHRIGAGTAHPTRRFCGVPDGLAVGFPVQLEAKSGRAVG